MPAALIVSPCVEIQIPSRAVVTPDGGHEVTQINRRSAVRRRHYNVSNFLLALELAGWIDIQILAFDLQLTTGHGYVSCAQNVSQVGASKAIGCNSFL